MNVRLLFPLLIITLLSCTSVSAHKIYNVTIRVNKEIILSQLKIYVDDGRSQKQVEIKDTQNSIIQLKGDYYSQYALIKLTYPNENSLVTSYENRFFAGDKAAVITLQKAGAGQSPFEKYTLTNAFDFKKEKDRMDEYTAVERAHCRSFLVQHDKEVFDGSDTAIQNTYFRLYDIVQKKEFDYVLKNSNSYYAFVYFRRNLLNVIPADEMLQVVNTTFPAKFINSEEGKVIKKYLEGKLATKINNISPDFNAKDINGDAISLSSFRNKKYVLLTFWATWCGPCMAEIPKIKAIYDKYSHNDIEIISIALKSNYPAYLKALKDNNMNWVNIYDDEMVINNYGRLNAIPQIYLLDKTGKIIYDTKEEEGRDSNLKYLEIKLNNLLRSQ